MADRTALEGAMLTVREIDAQAERLEEARETAARPLEQAAHAYLRARRRYARTGMYPSLRKSEHQTDKDAADFDVSNGIDYGDDFGVSITFEELAREPDEVRAEAEEIRRQREIKNLREEIERGQERLRALGVDC